MASVPLQFVPPDVDNLAHLLIFESTIETGPFAQIEDVTDIGDPGSYITDYTTQNALNAADWFAIQWVDDAGAKSALSAPIRGGATTLVARLIQRVRERNRFVDIHVIQQEAEVAIQNFYGENQDPYDDTLSPSYKITNGLTYMTLARTLMADLLSQSVVDQATIGLVSFKAANVKEALASVRQLIDLAEFDLGISRSLVLDMDRICQVYGGVDWRVLRTLLTNDQEFRFIPYQPWPVEMPGSRRSIRR